ncbi:GspH/FimT family pseudopilin [Ensifer sp. ENS12]|uniref:GspH/FimT family pseudopilin n=1 Tax=Ensifer sp. ENS12 TaxID=2854774 RepID=UPI001C489344|nr:GspH/FimT family pseudopilin [Ensifer sp. ENS12]MBV7518877.1 GspH/FimT family pseudopilin [Ensifer sp. ENS12]
MTRKPADHDNGFSIVEMLVVLAIIGLAAAIALPNLLPRRGQRPELIAAAAMQLAQTARLRAVSSGSSVSVVIDVAQNLLKLEPGVQMLTVPPGVAMEAIVGRDSTTTVDRGSIVFFPNGGSTGGQITFGDSSGRSSVLRVDWLTGSLKEIGNERR